MTIDEIRDALSAPPKHFPREALEAAIAQPGDVTPMLLEALEQSIAEPERLDEPTGAYMMALYAMHLLAQFREPAAYPLLVRLFSLEREWQEHFKEDVILATLPQLFASLCDDDLEPLHGIIENPAVDGYVRIAAIETLVMRVLMGLLARDQVIDYFRTLFNNRLEQNPLTVRSFLVLNAYRLYPEELLPEIRQAYHNGLVDSFLITLGEIEKVLAEDRETVLERSRQEMPGFFDDTIGKFESFPDFEENRPVRKPPPAPTPSVSRRERPAREATPPLQQRVPATRSEKVGRNDPCPCGSGKKYKKCCLNKA